MERKAIGFKVKNNVIITALMIFWGIVLIAGAILFFMYILGGAIGGAVAGGLAGAGVFLISAGIKIITWPSELVYIDAGFVYLAKTSIGIGQIKDVTSKGKTLTITPINGKKIIQSFIENCDECRQRITEAVQSQNNH